MPCGSGTRTNTGQLLTESAGLLECIDKMEARAAPLGRSRGPICRRRSFPASLGCAVRGAWRSASRTPAWAAARRTRPAAEVELYPDGTVEVRTSSAEIGQGLVTVLQMIAAEELGMPPSSVRVLLSDTDLTPDGGPTTASRQTYVSGNAVRKTAALLRQSIGATAGRGVRLSSR